MLATIHARDAVISSRTTDRKQQILPADVFASGQQVVAEAPTFSKSTSRRERKKRVGKVDRSLSRASMRPVLQECGRLGCSVDLPDSNADRYFGEAQAQAIRFDPTRIVFWTGHSSQVRGR
jgi:hypothetical protein